MATKAIGNSLRSLGVPVESWMRIKIEENLRKILSKLKPVTKDALKQDGMWSCVKKLVDEFVDKLWPELEEEIVYLLRFKYDQPPEFVVEKKKRCCCVWLWMKFRSFYLYAKYPVDSSIWE